MRVIAGVHRGRRLVAPDTPDTRPVTDRAKESIFSSIAALVPGAVVLDLYAGAGSFGVEALSRGAAEAVFVESGRKALAALQTNLDALGFEDVTVVRGRVEDHVATRHGPFDLVFCDPPWALPASDLTRVLESVCPSLAPGGVVVLTRRASDELPEPAGLAIADERRHGDTRIIRYTMESDHL